MANLIGIMGDPGSGKSTSLKGLPPNETYYMDCDGKGLNWRGWRNSYNSKAGNYKKCNEPEKVVQSLKAIGTNEKYKHIKFFVVDTVNNLMVSEEMRRCREKGYDKWTDLAQSVWSLVEMPAVLREDLTVILLFHTHTERTEDSPGFHIVGISLESLKS